jgi:hypothetical protein
MEVEKVKQTNKQTKNAKVSYGEVQSKEIKWGTGQRMALD